MARTKQDARRTTARVGVDSMRNSRTKNVSQILLFAALCASGGAGCASILGIGEGKFDGGGVGGAGGDGSGDGLVEDSETGIRTTEQCVAYCDLIAENCTGEFAQYTTRANCINACGALEPGDENEPIGNNVACRAQAARSAAGAGASELCANAGPAGEGSCGGKCEAWCTYFDAACPSQSTFVRDENCIAACEALPSEPGFDSQILTGDSIECRIYHANVALGGKEQAAIHCRHAQVWAEPPCRDTAADEVDCRTYCQTVKAACRDDLRVYESDEECLAACEVFPKGEPRDNDGKPVDVLDNTVSCRTYHANAALNDPTTHCNHASPTGAANCGQYKSSDPRTGTCDSYCMLYEAGCNTEFTTEFGSVEVCSENCKIAFANTGAVATGNNAKYQVESIPADSLQCHVYHAVKALASDDPVEKATLCESVVSTAECAP